MSTVGFVVLWDRSAAKVAERSASLVSERAMLSQIDAYVGGDGGWASGEVDPDEDDYPSGVFPSQTGTARSYSTIGVSVLVPS